MRLGIDLACLATARTGVGVYVREIVRELHHLSPEIVDLTPVGYPSRNQGPLGKIANNLKLWQWTQARLPQLAKQARCRALISPEYLAPRRASMPRIVVAHDAAFAKRPREYHVLWRLLFRSIYLPALRTAEAVVTVTEAAKIEIAQAYDLDPAKIHVIPNACNLEQFHPYPEAEVDVVLKKYGLPRQGYFLHVGVMEKRKNLPRLVRAFGAMVARYPAFRLVLAGQPGPKQDLDDYPVVLEEIRRLNLKEKILLPGFLPGPELPLLYQGARAMVFPTLYEGFGIPLLEALACGTAVACSDLPVLREVAEAAAFYFNPENEREITRTLERLVQDPAGCSQLVQQGQERVKAFSWERSAKQFIELAEALVGAKSRL